MVSKGQFLERPTLIPVAGGVVLEGLSHRGGQAPLVMVIPPPPFEGSGMDHVVGAEVAFAVTQHGHPCLRFNFQGIGGSQGPRSNSPEVWLGDARAALTVAKENAPSFGVLLVSLGASDAVALQLAGEREVVGACFISPTVLRAADIDTLPAAVTVGVVLPELDVHADRMNLGEALAPRDGMLTVVPGATRAYQRNLPQVGRAVAALAQKAGARRRIHTS